MLRASINYHGLDENMQVVTEGAKAGETGILHGEQILAFVEAAVRGDAAQLAQARDALRTAAGSEALVEAAAVLGNFQRQVRIADGTGIPLDGMMVGASNDLRQELGLNDFQTRRETELGPVARGAATVLRGTMKIGLRAAGWRSRKA